MWGRVCKSRILFLILAEKIQTNRVNKQKKIGWRETKITRQLLRRSLRSNSKDRHNRNQKRLKEIAKIKQLLKEVGVKKGRDQNRIRNLKLLINSDTIITSLS